MDVLLALVVLVPYTALCVALGWWLRQHVRWAPTEAPARPSVPMPVAAPEVVAPRAPTPDAVASTRDQLAKKFPAFARMTPDEQHRVAEGLAKVAHQHLGRLG